VYAQVEGLLVEEVALRKAESECLAEPSRLRGARRGTGDPFPSR